MNKEDFKKIEKIEPIFPEESSLVIEKILEKYELAQIEEKEIEEAFTEEDVQKIENILENLPGAKIAKLVREYAVGETSLAEIPPRLSQELNIPEKKAKQIFQDLEKFLLTLITPGRETELIREKLFKTIGEVLLGSKEPKPKIYP